MSGLRLICGVLAVSLGTAGVADAGVSPVASRAALAANDVVDWSVLGTGPFSYPPNPFAIASAGGLAASVSNSGLSTFRVLVQGVNWGGDFGSGDAILANTSDHFPGAITLDFETPISAAGVQVNVFDWNPFNVTIEAFDAAGTSLGSFAYQNLQMTQFGDDTAPFVGIRSDGFDIDKITIDTGTEAMAINQVGLVVPPPAIPAVSDPWLALLAGLLLAATGRRAARFRSGLRPAQRSRPAPAR